MHKFQREKKAWRRKERKTHTFLCGANVEGGFAVIFIQCTNAEV